MVVVVARGSCDAPPPYICVPELPWILAPLDGADALPPTGKPPILVNVEVVCEVVLTNAGETPRLRLSRFSVNVTVPGFIPPVERSIFPEVPVSMIAPGFSMFGSRPPPPTCALLPTLIPGVPDEGEVPVPVENDGLLTRFVPRCAE